MLREELDTAKGKLKEVNDRVHRAYQQAKVERDGRVDLDMSKVDAFGSGKTTAENLDALRQANEEASALGAEVERLEKALADYDKSQEPVDKHIHDTPQDGPGMKDQPREVKNFGERITEHKQFKAWLDQKGGRKHGQIHLDISPSAFLKGGDLEAKTTFSTGAGWAPESLRTGKLVLDAQRPVEVMDAFPMGTTNQAAIVYMEETTFTSTAAERAEAAAYAEATLALTEQSVTVRAFGVSIPVTDEQLEDVAGVQSYLDQRLRFMLRQKLDSQLLNGSGVAPQITGILNVGSIQTQALGGDPVPDAFYKAIDNVAVTGRAMANAIMIHRTDWQAVRLLRTADGIYIWGNPSEAGPERMWGLPVIVTTLSENTGLVGDFANFCMFFERRGITVEIAYDGDDFINGLQTIRAGMRGALVTYRPEAFCTVTGI